MDIPIVIGAAGKGTRMGDLTKDRPKHLLPVLGKPFLEHVLRTVKDTGFTEITIVAGYFSEQIRAFIKTLDFSVNVVDQFSLLGQERYGTACAVEAAREIVGDRSFVFMNGDNVYSQEDLTAMRTASHRAVIAGMEHPHPEQYGVLVANGNLLDHIEEKPEHPTGTLINVGLYRFPSTIFDTCSALGPSSRSEYELTDAVNDLAKKQHVHIHQLQGSWFDFGKPEDIPRVEQYFSEHGRVASV